MQLGAVYFIRLLAAASHLCPPIGRKKQLTSCHSANDMRNKICATQKISIEWDYFLFLYCDEAEHCVIKHSSYYYCYEIESSLIVFTRNQSSTSVCENEEIFILITNTYF